MSDDREIIRRSLDFQSRAKDFRLLDLPGYMEWSKRKCREGDEALIAHLDATCMWLLPEEAAAITEKDYEELLDDLRTSLETEYGQENG